MWGSLLFAVLGSVPVTPEETNTIELSPDSTAIDSGCNVLFKYDFKNRVLVDGKEHGIVPPPLEAGARVGYGFIYFRSFPPSVGQILSKVKL